MHIENHTFDELQVGDSRELRRLCTQDDLLVFAPSEEEALKQLEIVFSCLRANGLKLAQKKC